jgi:tryptophan halogenase
MKIVIVGGGTAGWLAALMLIKIQKGSHEVTLIESDKIGIIGAGEGSTGYLTDIIQGNNWDYGCNEWDFFKETNATVKLGIKHKDWKQVGHEYIAPIDGSPVNGVGTDYLLLYSLINDYPFHTSSQNGFFIENNLSSFFKTEGLIDNFRSHAYHFDANLVGKYFKKICGDDVINIKGEVIDLILDKNGDVEHLILDNKRKIYGDFFIDASGFNKIFSKKLKTKWVSYKKNLPVNTAMPFIIDYKDNEKIEPTTLAWAQKSGWMWKIPIKNRYGCGYVFDSTFTSEEEAVLEIEKKLNQKINPIKFIKFETGRLENVWEKNCLSIGLSAAFAEPLEATSIHSTIIQLNSFIFNYLKDTKDQTCNNAIIKLYNKKMSKMYDDYKDFLNIHYASERKDSNFWKWISTGETLTDNSKNILEIQKSKLLQNSDFDQYYGYAGASLYNWVLSGLGKISKKRAQEELLFFGQENLAETVWSLNQHSWGIIKNDMIENTDFIKNIEVYANGTSFSKQYYI